MNIALLGTRGIPANYGGFETFTEQLAVRLAARAHNVTVYCRSRYDRQGGPTYRGVRRVVLPTIPRKAFDTPVHTLLSCAHLVWQDQDVVLFCNCANALFSCWPRVWNVPTVLNVDGLDRLRRKWGRAARAWFRLSERWATLCPNVVVTDARVIQRYYRERHGLETRYIAYGAERGRVPSTRKLEELGLRPGDYFLYVSRFDPENNALTVVREFERSAAPQKLVMVGGAPYAADYIARVKATRDPRIVFPGFIYGSGYHELQSHCLAYIHATEVGGTHPALVEAMGRGCAVLYLDVPENREAASAAGLPFSVRPGSLRARIDEVAAADPARLRNLGEASLREAERRYDWDAITDRYEQLMAELVAGRSGRRVQ